MSIRDADPKKRESFIEGSNILLYSEWRVNGVLTTPSTYTCTIVDADGGIYPQTPTVVSTGLLSVRYKTGTVEMGERYTYLWTGTGAAEGAIEGSFYVFEQPQSSAKVYPDYG